MLAFYIFALSITCTVFVHAPPPMKKIRGYSAGGRGYSADVDIPLVGAFSTPMKEKRGPFAKEFTRSSPGGSTYSCPQIPTPPGGDEGKARSVRKRWNSMSQTKAKEAHTQKDLTEEDRHALKEKKKASKRAENVRQQEKRSSLSEKQQAAVKPAKSVANKKYYNKCKSAGNKKDRDAEEDARQAERYHRIQNWEETNEVARFAAWADSSRVGPIQHPVDVGLRELSFGTSTGRVLLQPMVPAVPPATSPDAGADNLEAQLFGIAATPFTGRIGASESMALLHAHEVKLYDITW